MIDGLTFAIGVWFGIYFYHALVLFSKKTREHVKAQIKEIEEEA